MTKKRPKTTDALMRYLREEKGISISGSSQKRKLMNIGYYHGYKGYRYIGKASNSIHYTNFDELMAVYEFDAQLKALFYPYVMQIETALKSYVLEVVVSQVNSDSFIDVYNKLLDNYKAFSTAGSVYSDFKQRKKAEDKFKYELKRRLDLRNRIYKVQTDAFGNGNKIAEHYLNNDMNLPIWAIYELVILSLAWIFLVAKQSLASLELGHLMIAMHCYRNDWYMWSKIYAMQLHIMMLFLTRDSELIK